MTKSSNNQAQRRRHTNSKLGCLNCKRKKIRCDENLPNCKNCLKSKKDSCSYLKLSIEEIEKIKITHSLRNSQNKLLNSNYRLPANRVIKQHPNKLLLSSEPTLNHVNKGESVLEFKYELSNLPIIIPNINYPPLQYNNLSMQNFNKEFKIINDFEIENDSNSNKNILPKGFEHQVKFKIMNKKQFKRKIKKYDLDFKRHLVIGESDLIDFISDELLFNNNITILSESIQLLGESIIVNHFKHSKHDYKIKRDNHIANLYHQCRSILNSRISNKNKETITYLTAYTLFFTNIMMKGSYNSYINSFNSIFESFKLVYETNNELIEFLRKVLQFNVISIHIPSYNPQFLFEIESNLRSLEFIFNSSKHQSINFSPKTKLKFENLNLQYSNLMKFLNLKVLKNIFSARDENLVTTYPSNLIYEISKEWNCICPSFAMNYRFKIDNSNYDESIFIKDLSTTLYTYYLAIASALDAVFPACKYLFSSNFILPTNGSFENKEILTISKYNPFINKFFNYEILQRHILYSSRLYSFFRKRFVFYHNNINWKNYYNNIKDYKFNTRKIINVKEIPINSFNTTIIRPEHYPTTTTTTTETTTTNNTNSPFLKYVSFNRNDESILKNIYSRNIETLNIFNISSNNILQYDYKTKLLLKDYRLIDDEINVLDLNLKLGDLIDYCIDKIFLLNSCNE
ncbi:uncharacterized protein KGF55_000510 [Candida pseudojiufengensis]|uniref:uncharacterized protein n=1 Tax=Candida pseudojiufengensis TaxID=497109 RepID=UPI002224AF58|nr:uncharacterized protein KGF55_000510 [Candida pseudojiufengensis]KAI5966201.1 hypothetical protein KGF55_000510 [Candida pseudojiufengensis]